MSPRQPDEPLEDCTQHRGCSLKGPLLHSPIDLGGAQGPALPRASYRYLRGRAHGILAEAEDLLRQPRTRCCNPKPAALSPCCGKRRSQTLSAAKALRILVLGLRSHVEEPLEECTVHMKGVWGYMQGAVVLTNLSITAPNLRGREKEILRFGVWKSESSRTGHRQPVRRLKPLKISWRGTSRQAGPQPRIRKEGSLVAGSYDGDDTIFCKKIYTYPPTLIGVLDTWEV